MENYTVFKGTEKEFTGNKKEIANHFNISYYAFIQRVKKGITLEEAIVLDKLKPYKIFTVFEGTNKEFTGTKADISKHFMINYKTFIRKIKNGYSLEEIINTSRNKNEKMITVFKGSNNEYSGNLKEIALHFGLNYNDFRLRVKSGFSPEEAVEVVKLNVKDNNLEYKGFKGDLKEICNHFNKDYINVYNLLKLNHTLDYAIENAKEKEI